MTRRERPRSTSWEHAEEIIGELYEQLERAWDALEALAHHHQHDDCAFAGFHRPACSAVTLARGAALPRAAGEAP